MKQTIEHIEKRKRFGADHYNWKGGRMHHSGYISIRVYPNDFFYPMASWNGYVREHRLVVAKSLGRNLHSWELIHHINGIKDDNRLENLELMGSQAEHFPSIKIKQELQKQAKMIKDLQSRVTLLEAENLLMRVQPKSERVL